MRSFMKKQISLYAYLLPIGMMALLLQGCYTQIATTKEDEPSYRQEESYSQQNDSTVNNENDYWPAHPNIGFSYYYPSWRSYWAWDYGCVYPTYWDPWYWSPAFYAGYYYYPHSWGYGNFYHNYDRWGFNGHNKYSRAFAFRNIGNQRGGNRSAYGVERSTSNAHLGSGSVREGVQLPRNAGTAIQTGRYSTSRGSRNGYSGISTSRQANGSRYNPSVQQPRHRDQSASTNGNYRIGRSHSRESSRSQGSSNGQSRSSGRSSAPSYSPQPSTRTNSSSSAHAQSGNSGGGRQSSGSGRSR